MKNLTIFLTLVISAFFASCQKSEDVGCVVCRTTTPYIYGISAASVKDSAMCGLTDQAIKDYAFFYTYEIHYRPFDTGETVLSVVTECH